MQTWNILSTTFSPAMLYVRACMYQTCTHAYTLSFVPTRFLEWGSIKHIYFFYVALHIENAQLHKLANK